MRRIVFGSSVFVLASTALTFHAFAQTGQNPSASRTGVANSSDIIELYQPLFRGRPEFYNPNDGRDGEDGRDGISGTATTIINMNDFRITNLGDAIHLGDAISYQFAVDLINRMVFTTHLTMNNINIKNVAMPVDHDDVATKRYVDFKVWHLYVNDLQPLIDRVTVLEGKIGGGWSGNATFVINMNGNRIKNVALPEQPDDAASKRYVDFKIWNLVTNEITDVTNRLDILEQSFVDMKPWDGVAKWDIQMQGNRITNLHGPMNGSDATNKDYVDNLVGPVLNRVIALEGASGWNGNANFVINMNGQKIINLQQEPGSPGDATSRFYVDRQDQQIRDRVTALENASSTGSGSWTGNATFDINMNSRRIINLQVPSGNDDAANKRYVDQETKKISDRLTSLEGSSGWTGNANFNINMNGRMVTNLGWPSNLRDATPVEYVNSKFWDQYQNEIKPLQDRVTLLESSSVSAWDGNATFRIRMNNNRITGLGMPTQNRDAVPLELLNSRLETQFNTEIKPLQDRIAALESQVALLLASSGPGGDSCSYDLGPIIPPSDFQSTLWTRSAYIDINSGSWRAVDEIGVSTHPNDTFNQVVTKVKSSLPSHINFDDHVLAIIGQDNKGYWLRAPYDCPSYKVPQNYHMDGLSRFFVQNGNWVTEIDNVPTHKDMTFADLMVSAKSHLATHFPHLDPEKAFIAVRIGGKKFSLR